MKFIYKLLPFILIFVFVFSLNINAADSAEQTSLYPCVEYDDWYYQMVLRAIDLYYSDTGSSEQIFVYARTSNIDSDTLHRLDIWIAPRSSAPGLTNSNALFWGYAGGIRRYYTYGSGVGNIQTVRYENSVTSLTLGDNSSAKYQNVYVSQDVFDDYGVIHIASPNPLYVEEEPEEDNDFFFGAFEDFADFGEESAEHYNNAMNQTVTENSNSPNDSVFQKLLQAMTGSLTTNNSITQQISNQLQHFTEQFFNNFAQYSLGLMNDILNTLNEFTGKFDSLLEITGQLYESGLDSNGNFDVGTMLSYWFVPDPDGIMTSLQDIVYSDTQLSPIISYADTFKEQLISIKPEAPEIIIPAGTYGSIVLEKDVVITFDWFEDWKQYSDPIIATFLYIAYFWHLFCQIPTIFHGGAATVASGNHYQEHVIREQNKQALKSHRG